MDLSFRFLSYLYNKGSEDILFIDKKYIENTVKELDRDLGIDNEKIMQVLLFLYEQNFLGKMSTDRSGDFYITRQGREFIKNSILIKEKEEEILSTQLTPV